MAIAVSDTATQTAGSPASPVTVNYPGSAVSGDLIVVIIQRSDATSAHLYNTPAGWTAIDNNLSGGNVGRMQTFWKISAGESSASFSYSAGTPSSLAITVYRITQAHPTAPIDSHSINAVTSGNPYTSTAITVVAQEAVLLSAFGRASGGANSWTPPAGQTEVQDDFILETTYETALVGAGSTGTRTATASAGTGAGAVMTMIAIAPSPGGKRVQVGRSRWSRLSANHNAVNFVGDVA